jgi:hypothetical protein
MVNTTSSWNTREFSINTLSSSPEYWLKVRDTFSEDIEYWLNKLLETSQENNYDFADVKFYLEYLSRQGTDSSVSDLGFCALQFINDGPAGLPGLMKDLREKDPQLARAYNIYHASLRISIKRIERRPWARNLQAYRDRALEIYPPELDENWD